MADRGFPLPSPVAMNDVANASGYSHYDAFEQTDAPSVAPVFAGFKQLLKTRAPDAPVHGLRPAVLRAAASWFKANFPGTAMYAVKCNPSPIVLQNLHAAGIDTFDVASLQEIEAVRAVAPHAKLFFMHPVKSRTAIRRAYFDYGVRDFSLDNLAELQKIVEETRGAKDLNLHVRLSLPKGEAFHALSQKFGISEADAPALMRAIKKTSAKLGLCFHVGSQTMSPAPYESALERVGTLLTKAKLTIDSLDVGGGFPVAYPGLDPAPMVDYMTAIRGGLAKLKLPKTCAIYGEPGRALVSEAGSLLVRVDLRKAEVAGNSLYINDGVYGSLFDTGLMGLMHSVRLHRMHGRKATTKALADFTLYGPTCDSVDTIKNYRLPADVQEGDWIEFGQTGSYAQAMQSNFNGFYSDDTVLLSDDPQLLTKGYWS